MRQRKIPIELNCGLDLVKEAVFGKWKLHLIYYISQGIKRPGELQRKIPAASRRVLNVQLGQLEAHGIIAKKVFDELPPRAEYSLTDFGCTLLPIVAALGNWGDENQAFLRDVIEKSTETLG